MKRAMQGIVLTALSVMLSSGVYAAESSVKKSALPVVPAHAAAEKPAEKVAASTAVALYESPELTSKVLGHFPVTANLVGIIRQGDWVKVGNRENGQTGWVNLKAYHAAACRTAVVSSTAARRRSTCWRRGRRCSGASPATPWTSSAAPTTTLVSSSTSRAGRVLAVP